MSYSKPHKSCQDEGIGFRTVNTLAQNQDDIRAALEVEHSPYATQPAFALGSGSLSGGSLRLAQYQPVGGEHDTPKVARGELYAVVDELFALNGNPIHVAMRSGVCKQLVRLDTGSYFMPIDGLTDFYAAVMPSGDVGCSIAQQTVSRPGSTPGIYITTWTIAFIDDGYGATGGYVATDMGFYVVVYGERGEPSAEVTSVPLKPSRFNRGPRPKFRAPR